MKLGCNVSELARELKLSRTLLYRWSQRAQGIQEAGESDPRMLKIKELEEKIASLEGVIGRQKLETDFFVGALRRVEELAPPEDRHGAMRSMPKSRAGQRRKAH
jgi:transposase-like protein